MIDVRGPLRRAAIEVSRYYRLRGSVENLDALAGAGVALSPEDHRLYFMFWQVTRVLDARPRGLAQPDARPPAVSR